MRIFLSCLQSPTRHAVSAYDFWGPYFKRGIEEAGHTWVEAGRVDWAQGLTLSGDHELRRWRDRSWSEVLSTLRTKTSGGSVDLFLGYLFPQMVDPGAVAEIRRMGIPCVNFFCDNVREFRSLPDSFRGFDLHWVPEFEALPIYEKARSKHVLAPMPCWVPQERRRSDHPETAGVTFAGSWDPLRAHLFGAVIRKGADISIAGAGWRGEVPGGGRRDDSPPKSLIDVLRNQHAFIRQHGLSGWIRKLGNRLQPLPHIPIPEGKLRGLVSADEYLRLVQQSAIALGVNRVQTFRRSLHRPLTYSRLRDIEAPMLGACYLTEWTESLSRFYDVGRHVEAYRTEDELIANIEVLLADPQRRKRLRVDGQAHALRELSVPRSLQKVTGALGLS